VRSSSSFAPTAEEGETHGGNGGVLSEKPHIDAKSMKPLLSSSIWFRHDT
jgi:hypothetical protein